MLLTSLPNEILQTIAANLETENEINRFILTSMELYSRLNDWFYRRNIRQGGWALFDAAYNGREDTAKRPSDLELTQIPKAATIPTRL